jgi:hypothetical protein
MWVFLVLATTGMLLISQGSFTIGDTRIIADIPVYVCWIPAVAAGVKVLFDILVAKKVFKEYKEIRKGIF